MSTDPTAEKSWRAVNRSWYRHYCEPEVHLTDGGPEFCGRFEEELQDRGVFQQKIDPGNPNQAGITERAGGLWKEQLELAQMRAEYVAKEQELEDNLRRMQALATATLV